MAAVREAAAAGITVQVGPCMHGMIGTTDADDHGRPLNAMPQVLGVVFSDETIRLPPEIQALPAIEPDRAAGKVLAAKGFLFGVLPPLQCAVPTNGKGAWCCPCVSATRDTQPHGSPSRLCSPLMCRLKKSR